MPRICMGSPIANIPVPTIAPIPVDRKSVVARREGGMQGKRIRKFRSRKIEVPTPPPMTEPVCTARVRTCEVRMAWRRAVLLRRECVVARIGTC